MLSEALDGEDGGALRALAAAERALGQLERVDTEVSAWRELLDGAYAQLSEVARLASAYAEGVERDPARLESVERRRDLLFRCSRSTAVPFGGAGDTPGRRSGTGTARHRGCRPAGAGGEPAWPRTAAREAAARLTGKRTTRPRGSAAPSAGCSRSSGSPAASSRWYSRRWPRRVRMAPRAWRSRCASTWGSTPSRSRRWRRAGNSPG